MSNTAIEVSNLGKKYHIAALKENPDTLITALGDIFTAPFRRAGKLLRGQQTGAAELDQEFWALRDINFEVKNGEVMGIIGRNGAGKSTLLKVLSRITEPSEGFARINGRVGSLLEVGTGFHNELTGRENVYLNGSILGMSNAEITNRFDEIVSFSEIGNFLDTPVKHYSSGMKVRLAFAVAAHLDPEILLIDEVLAVGDYAFQKKSLGKMQEVTHNARTVLFVSHQLDMIRTICNRVIWIDGGYVKMIGDATTVVDTYINSFSDEGNNTSFTCEEDPERPFQLLSGRILNQDEKASAVFDIFEPITVELDYVIRKSVPNTIISIRLTSAGEPLFHLFDTDNAQHLLESRTLAYYRTRVQIPAPLLKQGFYSLDLSMRILKSKRLYLHELKNALSIEVLLNSRAGNHLSYGKGRRIKVVVDSHWENEILRDMNKEE
jgi:homopolymeric O-antigen transport system ATP-binding protein